MGNKRIEKHNTMKDYKKLYEDAIEKIRKGIQPLQDGSKVSGVTKGFLEEVFPELCESEDEGIRKSIIAIINNYVDNSNTFKPKMLGWLEKQGQVKESSILQQEGTHEDVSCKEKGSSLTREQKPQRFISAEVKEALYDKLAWSEEDEEMARKTLVHFVATFDGDCSEKVRLASWLESLKERVQPQPKQEWSERDEGFLNQTIEEVDYALNDKDMFYNGDSPLINWLKDLKQRLGGE